MNTQKVVFVNKELNTRMAGLLRLPEGFDLSKDYITAQEERIHVGQIRSLHGASWNS